MENYKKLNENLTATIHTKHWPTRKIRIKDSIRQGGVLSVLQYALLMDEITKDTGGNRTMVAAITIVSMAAAKKTQQNVFALYHSYDRTILLGFIWILDFHFKIVLVFRWRYLIAIRCNNGKEKYGLDDGCTILIFSTDDGCTRWWRWLHYFGWVIFDARTADPLQTNMLIGCMIVVKCDTCKISGSYAYLDCITSTVGDIGNRHSMQVTHSYKECIFHLFAPQVETYLWMIWHHKLKLPLSAKYSWFQGMIIRVEQCAKFEAINSFHNARNPPIWPVSPIRN